jgi:hypothetical protein
MVCIASIATHDSPGLQRMGLRRALLARRANLGDCPDAASVIRRLLLPRSLQQPACVVPLPRRSRGQPSAADLAEQVARQALHGAAGLDPLDVGALIYSHATPDERTTDSTAGRLQHVLGLRRASPFSVSQAHNTSLLVALDLAAGLIEGPESAASVLLVAADKLLFRQPPHPAQDMVWGDVAAAAVLVPRAQAGWHIASVVLRHFAAAPGPHRPWPAAHQAAFAQFGAQALQRCLAEAGLAAGALATVLTTSPDACFVHQVHQAAGLPAPAGAAAPGLRATHAACADFLVRLARLQPTIEPGRPLLAWCHGSNGEFACAMMTLA